MKFSPRTVLCLACVFAVAVMILLGSTPPSGVLADETEEQHERERFEGEGHQEERSSDDQDLFMEEEEKEEDGRESDDEDGYDLEDAFEDDWEEESELALYEHKAVEARIARLCDVAADESRTAAYVLDELIEVAEPEDSVRVLLEATEIAERPILRRMIQIRLIELYAELDQPRKALGLARDLISGK